MNDQGASTEALSERPESSSPDSASPFRLTATQWGLVVVVVATVAVTGLLSLRTAVEARDATVASLSALKRQEAELTQLIRLKTEELRQKEEQLAAVNVELDAYASRQTLPTSQVPDQAPTTPIDDAMALVSLFSGPQRKVASDRLIELYAKGKRREVVSALVSAIQEKDVPSSYRVNLYVLFTLARIGSQWEGQQAEIAKIRDLLALAPYYRNDSTYLDWGRKAVAKAKQVP